MLKAEGVREEIWMQRAALKGLMTNSNKTPEVFNTISFGRCNSELLYTLQKSLQRNMLFIKKGEIPINVYAAD